MRSESEGVMGLHSSTAQEAVRALRKEKESKKL